MVKDEGASVLYATFPRRLLALCVDLALIFGCVMGLTVGAESVPIQTLWTVLFGLFFLGLILYEPLLVSVTGGTLGHHALNLRVAKEGDGGNLGFFSALIRGWLKGILGILSFFFMGLTLRHQALHDLATKSSVQIKDPEKAMARHYVRERAVSPGAVQVSRLRRGLVIGLWSVGAFALMSFASFPFVSDACALQDLCSEGEELVFDLVTLGWFVSFGIILLLGWRGMLPGARGRPLETDGMEDL